MYLPGLADPSCSWLLMLITQSHVTYRQVSWFALNISPQGESLGMIVVSYLPHSLDSLTEERDAKKTRTERCVLAVKRIKPPFPFVQ